MAEEKMLKLAGEVAHRLNERLFREEERREASRREARSAKARSEAAMAEALRQGAERPTNGGLN